MSEHCGGAHCSVENGCDCRCNDCADAVRATIAMLYAELEGARTKIKSLEKQLDFASVAFHDARRELLRARSELSAVATGFPAVWLWQGGGIDEVKSLVCPVVMTAETARDFKEIYDAVMAFYDTACGCTNPDVDKTCRSVEGGKLCPGCRLARAFETYLGKHGGM